MKVWVVELWDADRDRWVPTVGIGLSKKEALAERWDWVYCNPNDKFRVVRYTRMGADG